MPTLRVLGSCAGWPEAGRACAGYVVECDGSYLVLDLGFGTLSRLLDVIPDLSSIVGIGVTHAHPDHLSDLIGLCRAAALLGSAPSWPLIAPEGVREAVAAGDPDGGTSDVARALTPPARRCDVGPFAVTTQPTPHYLPNLAVRVEVAGRSLVYTGDTGPDAALAEFARGADLLLSDCTDRHQQGGTPDHDSARYLMTAHEVGRLATAAAARALVLTHFWPGNDRERSRRAAATEYAGSIAIAEEGSAYSLT